MVEGLNPENKPVYSQVLRPSTCMLNNLFINALIYRVDPACLAIAIALATAG
jgi:hypothetical protein